MAKKPKQSELESIPGVGPSIAEDLRVLGYRTIADLKDQNPQYMYDKLCALQGAKLDRCLLYVFRCAVYFASNSTHQPSLLLWWNWKNKDVA